MPHKNYHREYNTARYRARRIAAIAYLGGCCVNCESDTNLEFDHIDPTKKSFDSKSWMSVSLQNFWSEIAKCQLLCHICHLDKTLKERGQISAKGTHGTVSAYRYCGPPKCEACRAAKRTAQARRRQR